MLTPRTSTNLGNDTLYNHAENTFTGESKIRRADSLKVNWYYQGHWYPCSFHVYLTFT